jgi:hypothetical protein
VHGLISGEEAGGGTEVHERDFVVSEAEQDLEWIGGDVGEAPDALDAERLSGMEGERLVELLGADGDESDVGELPTGHGAV